VRGSCSAPKIQVQTPFSQPQKPPADADELAALGDADGLLVAALPAALLLEADADGDADALGDFAVPAFTDGVLLALAFGVGVADFVAEDEPPAAGVVVAPQIAVANGSAVEEPAAFAGAARASVPATATAASGTETAAIARRVDGLERTFSVLRVLVGTGVLHFRKVARGGFGGFVLGLFAGLRRDDARAALAARRRLPARLRYPGG
jgi:hypothetical protein